MMSIAVYGKLADPHYHRARLITESVMSAHPEFKAVVKALTPIEYDIFAEKEEEKLKKENRHSVTASNGSLDLTPAAAAIQGGEPLVFEDGKLVGGTEWLSDLLEQKYNYDDPRPYPLYKALSTTEYKKFLELTKHSFYFIEVSIDNKVHGRLVIELFTDVCPKTCANFEKLCTGAGAGQVAKSLHFQSSSFHRIVKNGWIQGGDICGGHGDGGESVYGPCFADENYIIKHDQLGIVGMANKGPHTNNSQFYITMGPTPWMDRKYVAFGKLIDGYKTLKAIEALETQNDRPLKLCVISDCGKFIP